MKETIQQLVEWLKSISPYLWHVAFKQAITDALVGELIGAVLIGAAIWLRRAITKYELREECFALSVAGIIVFGIAGLMFVGFNLIELINPDYAAMEYLMHLVPMSGK